MNGLLITNKYMASEKFETLKKSFIDAANDLNVKLDYMNNLESYDLLSEPIKYDFIIFYDKDIKLARMLEEHGYRLFNSSEAIATCDDKFLTYMKLVDKVRQPMTIASPFLYYGDLSSDQEFIKKCEEKFSYPMIIKECLGSFGMQVYKVDSNSELVNCIKQIGNKAFIVQEFIETSFGKDVRLQVVGDKVVCAMMRINDKGDFRANVTNGAVPYEYTPSDEECELAVKAAKEIGVDFAGVDLLFGNDSDRLFCEINSNAHLEIIGKVSKVNVYKKILECILKEVKA